MFTGIISDIGHILTSAETVGDLRVTIGCSLDLSTVALGASIACSGICLTVVDKGDDWFAVDVSEESRRRSAAGMWAAGRLLNLERSLKVGDELGGHIVTGHVDGIGRVIDLDPRGGSIAMTIEAEAALAPYIAEKGSIAIDGVSLTVNQVTDGESGAVRFAVNLIPHTASLTTLGRIETDKAVNLEIDILARYLGRMMDARSSM